MRRSAKRGIPPFWAGVLVLAVAALATYVAFSQVNPFHTPTEVRAVFASSNNVRAGSPVRIAGVTVGKVKAVDHLDGGRAAAVVTMELEDEGLPLHRDARAAIRPRIFLEGNFFVDLEPGSPSAPLLDGDTIPINQTRAPVQLDQVLSVLQPPTRRDLRALLQELGSGLGDGGAEGYNRSIPHWEAAYRDTALVNDAALGTQPDDLQGYVRGAARVAEALDGSSDRLQALVTDLRRTGDAFAARDEDLSAAVAELPRTLRAAQPALGALNDAFPPLRRLVASLRPATRSALPALRTGTPLVTELRGLLSEDEGRGLARDLRPAIPSLASLTRRTVPLYEQVRRASSCQNEVILPWANDRVEDPAFPTDLRVYEEAVRPLPGLAGESRSGDANGQWFRVMATGGLYAYPAAGGAFYLTGKPLSGVNPPPSPRSPLRTDVPCETQERPDLRSTPGAPPKATRVAAPPADLARASELAAVRWLRRTIKEQGLGRTLRVSAEALTKGRTR